MAKRSDPEEHENVSKFQKLSGREHILKNGGKKVASYGQKGKQ